MTQKRVTIYDLAKELGVSASYISKALNNHPTVSEKAREEIKLKAKQMNYKHNSLAANLRMGASKTLGVVVPRINQTFFSDTIAGIEEVCFENNHSLIVCQSYESYQTEGRAIETLIRQNVGCIFISVSAETQSPTYLQEIIDNNIPLIQFDRCLTTVDSHKVENDNIEASYKATKHLLEEGYTRIAFIGGPEHLPLFNDRKTGFLKALKEAQIDIPYSFVTHNQLSKEAAMATTRELLQQKTPPDAFFTVSDLHSLGIMQVAGDLHLRIPEQIGIMGFANESITELVHPSLSSVNQRAMEIGRCAARIYFEHIHSKKQKENTFQKKIVESEIIIRESTHKAGASIGG